MLLTWFKTLADSPTSIYWLPGCPLRYVLNYFELIYKNMLSAITSKTSATIRRGSTTEWVSTPRYTYLIIGDENTVLKNKAKTINRNPRLNLDGISLYLWENM
jgi:hypothetical protein